MPEPIAASAEPARIAGNVHSEPGLGFVNREEEAEQLARLREAVNRGSPYGSDTWRENAAKKLGLESTIRPRGRPKKAEK